MPRKYQVREPLIPADGPGTLHVGPEPEQIVVDWGNYPAATPDAASQQPAPDRPARRPAAEPASRTARVVAVLVDALLGLLPWVLGLIFLGDSSMRPEMKVYGAGGVVLVSLALGVAQMTLLAVRGQSLGKIALGIRIVSNLDGDNPGFWRVVVWRKVVPSLIGCVPIIGQVFVLFDVLSLFGEDRRCLHDLLADTKVVDV